MFVKVCNGIRARTAHIDSDVEVFLRPAFRVKALITGPLSKMDSILAGVMSITGVVLFPYALERLVSMLED